MNGLGNSLVPIAPVRKPRSGTALGASAGRRSVASIDGVRQQVASLYLTAAVLATIGFLYGSAIPLIFAVPDYDSRIRGAFEPSPWNMAQLFDVLANVAAFVPVGFLWAAACNTLLPKSRAKSGMFVTIASGCLCLALLAETLQIWIPLRDPSIRDVLALEWGAVLGYGLWERAGRTATLVLSHWIDRLSQPATAAVIRYRWAGLFAGLLAACLLMNCYASPTQLFLLYRFRSTSLEDVAFALHNANVKQLHDPRTVLLPSLLTAIVLIGLCFAAQRGVRFALARRGRTR
jgi:VanZ family protein